MQNRADAGMDREVGHLEPQKGYAFIDAVRVAFDVGALGLGASGNISKNSSLLTTVAVEGFCAALSGAVAVHEVINVSRDQCCRRDNREVQSTNLPATQYSTYLTFRLISIFTSVVGLALIAADLGADVTTSKTTIGLVAISLGIFASRALSGSRHKPAGTVLAPDDDIELGLVADLPPPPAPPAVAPIQNQFFQPAPAPAPPPAPQGPEAPPPRRAARKVKVRRQPHQ